MGFFLLSLLKMFCFCYKSDSNSSSSDGSRARSVQSSAAPQQPSMVLESDEPRRSFGIKVQNLPVRSTGEWCCCFLFFYSFQYSRKPFLKDSCLSNQYYVTKLQTKINQCHENVHVLQNHETRINIFSQPY